jgi:sugar-specific transcriptional regulator TrmB
LLALDSEDLDKSIGQLLLLGLTKNEAKMYLALASGGEDSAGALSKKTKINRIDAYRLLNRLAQKELVHVILGRPIRYKAVDPNTTLRNLYDQKKRSLITIRDSIPPLVETIERLKRNYASSEYNSTSNKSSFYTLAYGRSSYLSDVTKMTESTRKILCIVMTQNAMKRAFSRGTPDLWTKKISEGVEIRMIVDRRSVATKEVHALPKTLDIKSAPNAMMRLTIFDDSSILLCATDDVDLSVSSPFDVYLKTNDEKFSKVLRLLFDHMWKNARPLKQ